MRFVSELKETIVDTGGSRPLTPLQSAGGHCPGLTEPVPDWMELVPPSGDTLSGTTHQVAIPVAEPTTNSGERIKTKKGSTTFWLGRAVPYVATSRAATRQLDLRDSLRLLGTCEGDSPAVPVEAPTCASVPSHLSDTKWSAVAGCRNGTNDGHGGEQRTCALTSRRPPSLEVTRGGTREYTRYCSRCQKKSSSLNPHAPHQPLVDDSLNLLVADLWTTGDCDEETGAATLAVVDLRSRHATLEEAGSLSSEETAVRLLRAGSVFSLKGCVLRTGPGTGFTGKGAQDVLKPVKADWGVGLAGGHLEQSNTERCFRELSSRTRPTLVSPSAEPLAAKTEVRTGARVAARAYSSSINCLGLSPAQVFTPSEALELQAVHAGGVSEHGAVKRGTRPSAGGPV